MRTNDKKAMSFENIVKYTSRVIDNQTVFNQIEYKRMSNNSVAVKYKNSNKRICRIDTAYDKMRIVTNRIQMFDSLDYVEHYKKDMRVYRTILCNKEDFAYNLYRICENAMLLAEEE